ncbi:MAG: ribonuclease HII [Patescibacteria group bacterium]|jgi:ribonuclease HII
MTKRGSLDCKEELRRWGVGLCHPIGVDEVGRGCLAGPVVAGAVLFDWSNPEPIYNLALRFPIRDSKTLSRKQRQETSKAIRDVALAVGIAEVDAVVIDEINILQATLRAMSAAVRSLPLNKGESEGVVFVDGNQRIPNLDTPQETVVDGDAKIFSIAAASIVAKEYRDLLMEAFDDTIPGYNFSSHKGYGTKAHVQAIRRIGLSPIHRRTFWHG